MKKNVIERFYHIYLLLLYLLRVGVRRTDFDLLSGEANLVLFVLHEVFAVQRLRLAVDVADLGGEGLFLHAPLLGLLPDPLLVLLAGGLAGLVGHHVGLGSQGGGGHDAGPGGLDVTDLLVVEISTEPTGLVPQEVLVGLDLQTLTVSVDGQAVEPIHHSVHSVLVAGHVGSLQENHFYRTIRECVSGSVTLSW